MRKISKVNNKKFKKKCMEMFNKYGITETGSNFYEYQLDTQYGLLRLSVHDEEIFTYSIFTRFDEPEKAKEKFACNPYSGKYNFHCADMETTLNSFERFIKEVI